MAASSGPFDLSEYIIHHVSNANSWHLPFLPEIPLPAPFSLHGMMVVLCAAFLIILFALLVKKDSSQAPSGITNVAEVFVKFVRDEIAIPSLGKKDGVELTPLFCTFFFFILGLNVMGLIPLFSTATANYNVTGGLASITLGFMIFGAIYKNGVMGFLKAFVPSGVPIFVLPIISLIEFMGIFIKSVALMIRLSANLLAGHIIIFAFLGLVVLLGPLALPSVFLAIAIYFLEILVAFLQAFIFTLLSALFIGHLYHPDH